MTRTQQQRRAETVARLIDAGIDTIIELGYARASAAVIAKRAGVSGGALFRHFPTMSDFMAATAQEVARRQLDLAAKLVAQIPAGQPPLPASGLLRCQISSKASGAASACSRRASFCSRSRCSVASTDSWWSRRVSAFGGAAGALLGRRFDSAASG